MDGAFPHALLHDDALEPLAAGLVDVPLEADGPLPFDVLLGPPFPHVVPNEPVAVQDNPHLDDEGPLPFDVLLGHPFHAALDHNAAAAQLEFTLPLPISKKTGSSTSDQPKNLNSTPRFRSTYRRRWMLSSQPRRSSKATIPSLQPTPTARD
ncbi:unnamed protein product [Peniophora sp. CBMAI 1063]|nr:unnamed protein product [Peniophora sp. CBMAI 1063]